MSEKITIILGKQEIVFEPKHQELGSMVIRLCDPPEDGWERLDE